MHLSHFQYGFSQDLLEYISQLLGGKSSEIDEFVENVGRYQQGEALVVGKSDGQTQTIAMQRETLPTRKDDSVNPLSKYTSQTSSTGESTKDRLNQPKDAKKSRVPPPKSTILRSPPSSSQTEQFEASQQISTNMNSSDPIGASVGKATPSLGLQQPIQQGIVHKSHPRKGKAKKVCGCFGTKHEPLTNCLYCGRISCTIEGYDFCSFCGYMVEEFKVGMYVSKNVCTFVYLWVFFISPV